jgi:hypothetical protein
MTGAERQRRYVAKLKAQKAVVPLGPPVVPLGPYFSPLGLAVPFGPPPVQPLGSPVIFSAPLVFSAPVLAVPVVPLGPPQMAVAVQFSVPPTPVSVPAPVPVLPASAPSIGNAYRGTNPTKLWEWSAVRDIRWADRSKTKLQFKLRWLDLKRDRQPYSDSWVHEASIPNKKALYTWLLLNTATDPVLSGWLYEIVAKAAQWCAAVVVIDH